MRLVRLKDPLLFVEVNQEIGVYEVWQCFLEQKAKAEMHSYKFQSYNELSTIYTETIFRYTY